MSKATKEKSKISRKGVTAPSTSVSKVQPTDLRPWSSTLSMAWWYPGRSRWVRDVTPLIPGLGNSSGPAPIFVVVGIKIVHE